MRKISYWFVAFMVLMVAVSCADYDEGLDILSLDVQLEFPSSYDGAHNGLRVELQNGVASTFVDSTRSVVQPVKRRMTIVISSMEAGHKLLFRLTHHVWLHCHW